MLLNYLHSLLVASYLFLDTLEQKRMPRTAGLSPVLQQGCLSQLKVKVLELEL